MPDQNGRLAKIRQKQEAIKASIRGEKAPKKVEPSDKGMSVGGFVENVGEDAFDIAKGLFVNLPAAAAGAISKYISDPSSLSEIQFTGSTLGAIKDAIIEPYEKHGLKVLYHRPVTTLLDALAIWSLGTSTAARTARLAGSVRGEQIARTLQKLPSSMVRQGIDKTALAFGKDLPARRKFLELAREEESRRLTRLEGDYKQVAKKVTDLSDGEAADFHRFRTMGGTLQEVHASPRTANALRTWREFVERWQDEFKGRGVLTDEMIDEALVKKYAFEKHGAITKEFLEEARDAIKASEVRPVYGPSIIEQGKAFNLDDLFTMPELTRTGKVGFLERFRGGQGALTDPRKYIPKAIEAFREAEKRFRLTDRVLQNPEWVKAVGRGEAGMGEMFREGVFKRYFDDRVNHAQALRVKEIFDELKAAGKTPKEIATALSESSELRQRILDAKNIAVSNPTVRNLLKWEFTSSTNGLLRLYDGVLAAFKKSATRLNPRWYTGNVIGDAFLGTLGGSRWVDATRLIQKGMLPMEAAAKAGQAGAILGNAWWNKLERAVDIAGAADQATRAGLIIKKIRDHFVDVGRKFELSSASLKDVLRSPENFSEVQVQMQRLEEQVASRSSVVAKVDSEIAKLTEKEVALTQRLETAEMRRAAQNYDRTLRMEEAVPSGVETLGKKIETLTETEREAAAKLEGITSPQATATPEEYGRAVAELKASKKTERLGQKAASLKSKIDSVLEKIRKHDEIVRGLSKTSADIVAYAQKLFAKEKRSIDRMLEKRRYTVSDRGGLRLNEKQIQAVYDAFVERFKEQGIQLVKRKIGPKRQRLVDQRDALNSQFRNIIHEAKGIKQGAELAGPIKRATDVGQRAEALGKRMDEAASKRVVLENVRAEKIEAHTGDIERQKQNAALGLTGEPKFEAMLDDLNSIRQRITNLTESRSAIVRDLTEDVVKRGELEKLVPGLTEQVKVLRDAVDYANAFVGEYNGLSGFERKVMTRIIPFYAWTKAMTMLAFRLPFIAPVKTFAWHNFGMAMWNMVGDHEMPEYTKGYVPMFARENGDLVWLKFSSFNPFGGLHMSKVGEIPIPSIAAAGEANPIFSLALRIHGGRTVFDRSTLPYGERMVNITNGDVYEYTGRGTLRKTIPQAPLISSILHMFPITQLAEDILLPYSQGQHNWIGFPKPALKPDGSYRYPKELLERIALLGGISITERKRKDFINTERMRVYQAIRDLRKSWTKADPDERKFIEQAMKDYARGEYRRIEAY